ncbi:TonB family protein [Iningainema tapete]|uniref:TonB family protein n=1 Tax=Iningainema tapete BLCC-T55 TaxID=2748662 RepID=A0A8J7CH84_9CYAN|nr:TonB family protein [Iningainema tapete]MBD2777330.1 TonB family protein [Iningainema tapete BLCC-T55]
MESLILERNRSHRPKELVLGLFTSIILHTVIIVGGHYWLRLKAPEQKQDLSEAIPIEYIEVPANETKKPPETSRRADRNSVAGGEAKPKKVISIAKSAPTKTDSNQDLATPTAEIIKPQPIQPKAPSPNLRAPKLPLEPPKIEPSPNLRAPKLPAKLPQIAVAPTITEPKLQPESTARTRTIPQILQPQPTAPTPDTTPQIPTSQSTTVIPTTTPLKTKLRQFATARTIPPIPQPEPTTDTSPITPPKPEPTIDNPPITPPKPQPTKDTSNTTSLETKLRQFATARTQLPEPQPQPTALTPDPTPPLLTQPTPLFTPPVPPTTTPLGTKLRQFANTRTTLPEPQPTVDPPSTKPSLPTQPITNTPSTTPSPLPQTTVTTRIPPTPTRPKITTAPTTPPISKLSPTKTPTTSLSGRSTRPVKNNQLAANSSSVPTTRTSTRSQSLKGSSSRLGGPVVLSNRNFTAYVDQNSNRQKQGTEGVDARQDVDLGPYLRQLQAKVKQQWIPGVTQSSRRTVLHFTILRSGEVKYLEVAQSSGFDFTDEAALGAVQRATPFAPLPTNYPDKYLNIRFTFNINIYGELELSGD